MRNYSPLILPDWSDARDWRRVWRDPPRWRGCGCCQETYGYVAGGTFIGQSAVTDKVAFSAQTVTATPGANLSQARSQYPAGVGNPAVAGYFCGGLTASAAAVATADKLVFSTDITSATASANLANVQSGQASLSERSTKGYFAGGTTTGDVTTNITATAHKLTFSGDSTSAQGSADLSQTRYNLVGISEGTSKGYWLGGSTGAMVATGDKLTFSGDSTAAQGSADLSQARNESCATSDGSTYGYVLGGQTSATVSTVDRLTFSTDTTAARTTMALSRVSGAAMSNGVLAVLGGFNGSDSNTLELLTFSTEVISSFTGTLSASRNYYGMVAQAAL